MKKTKSTQQKTSASSDKHKKKKDQAEKPKKKYFIDRPFDTDLNDKDDDSPQSINYLMPDLDEFLFDGYDIWEEDTSETSNWIYKWWRQH